MMRQTMPDSLKERCRTFLEIMKLAVYIQRTQQCSLSEAFERAKKEKDADATT